MLQPVQIVEVDIATKPTLLEKFCVAFSLSPRNKITHDKARSMRCAIMRDISVENRLPTVEERYVLDQLQFIIWDCM